MLEGTLYDQKSLRVLTQKQPDWRELAKDCVAFANAQGGTIAIGIEDGQSEPPVGQRVPDQLVVGLNRRIPQITINVATDARKAASSNGGEYIAVKVFRSAQTIAATSDGRYFLRIGDQSKPLMPEDLARLSADKNAYVWEALTTKRVPRRSVDADIFADFLARVRSSQRVSEFVRRKPDDEVLDHYLFADGEWLTNLGILWVGRRSDRATLLHAPVVQFTKYDETGAKISKRVWDEHDLNPLQLIEEILRDIPDWREGHEVAEGMFRTTIPNYDRVVIRELVVNALVHRPYTMRGDIYLNLYPDRLEIHNPGQLPLGVTPENILHASVRRNEHLAKVFYDLQLMEREGSGYDMIYDVLLGQAKQLPRVQEGHDRVAVVLAKRIVRPETVDFMRKADQALQLGQRERIGLGLVAQHGTLSAVEFARLLELPGDSRLRDWVGRLVHWKVILTRGQTKGMEYFIDPELLRTMDFRGRTTLKGIEDHRLDELLREDLRRYPGSGISAVHQRVGHEIPLHRIRSRIGKMRLAGQVRTEGLKRGTRYWLNDGSEAKKAAGPA